MNAQEAIDQFEMLLNSLKEHNKYSDVLLYGDDTLEPDVIQLTNKGFEALAIVLESAKLLHEVLNSPTTEVREVEFIKCFINGSITVDKNVQRKIGIEVTDE